jgi:uncharacterized protein YihD (DUF1040 family)
MTMKFVQPAVLILAMAFATSTALAADAAPAKPLTPQQQKMKDCSAQATAKGLKGKEYTDFKNNCLKADSGAASSTPAPTPAPAKPMTQQEKMTACNAEATAKGLKGKDYTDFRNTCLKGGSSASAAH